MSDEQNSQQDEPEVEGQGSKKVNDEAEPDAGEATTDDSPEVEGQRFSGLEPAAEVEGHSACSGREPAAEVEGHSQGHDTKWRTRARSRPGDPQAT